MSSIRLRGSKELYIAILQCLAQNEYSVSELAVMTNRSKSHIETILPRLQAAGLVTRTGEKTRYRIAKGLELEKWIKELEQSDAETQNNLLKTLNQLHQQYGTIPIIY